MKALILSLLIILSMSAAKAGTAAESIPELAPFGPFSIPENEAMVMMDQMGVGWNLGNTFDAFQDPYRGDEMRLESYWNGCMTTDAMFEALSNAGFRSVRIPVSWHNHVDKNFRISEKWLNRVQEGVDYAYHRGMYVILNTHHDSFETDLGNAAKDEKAYKKDSTIIVRRWDQVATKFAGYSDKLIFETFNEIHADDNWNSASDAEYTLLNQWNQWAVDAIRKTNPTRWIGVAGYAANIDMTIEHFVLPTDPANKLIVAVHCYDPYNFCTQPYASGDLAPM